MSLTPEAMDAFNKAVADHKDEINELVDSVMQLLHGNDISIALAVIGNVIGEITPEHGDLEVALNIIADLAAQVSDATRTNEVMQ